jgi:WD40 repeat protein
VDLRQGTRTGFLTGHKANVVAVQFSPGRAILISASEDGEVRLWDLSNRRTQLAFDIGDHGLPGLMLSQDGKTLATSHTGDIRFWDLADGHLAKGVHLGCRLRPIASQAVLWRSAPTLGGPRDSAARFDCGDGLFALGQNVVPARGHHWPRRYGGLAAWS